MYRLKPNEPDIQIMSGPFRGRKFLSGQSYSDVPVNEAHRFQEVNEERNTPGEDNQNLFLTSEVKDE